MSNQEPIRSKIDPMLSDEEEAERYLARCKHHLHPENKECWMDEKFTSNKHEKYMESMNLPGLNPKDVIHPIEHGYYNYLNTTEILIVHTINGFSDHIVRYNNQYRKQTGIGGEK